MRIAEIIRDHVDNAFSSLMEGPPRKRALRCSSLPYCPILDAVMPREAEFMDLNGALYTSMGTAAHEALQLYMSLGKLGSRVFGDWECRVCKKEWKRTERPVQTCCGMVPKYVELAFRVGPMTGHLDLLAHYSKNWWNSWEFKTIGTRPDMPKRQHALQIRTYNVLLKYDLKIDVRSHVILYLGREKLERTVFGPFDSKRSFAQTKDWTFRAIAGYKAATRLKKDPSVENIKAVVAQRPCTSRDTHDDYMGRRYDFSIKPCPMLTYCSRGDAACGRAVRDVIRAGAAA